MKPLEDLQDISLLIISGSSQQNGQSLKVATCIQNYLKQNKINNLVVDLHALDLPLFGLHQKKETWQARWQKSQPFFQKAHGVILISPEYNGSPSPAILNLMLYVQDELRHKPVLPIGVSAGRGGAYPVHALRQNGFKDPGYVVIPTNVIVSHVNDFLNDYSLDLKDQLSAGDLNVRKDLQNQILVLLNYAFWLKNLYTN